MEIRADSIQTLRFQTEDGGDSQILAIFFSSREAEACAEFLCERFPLPEGYVIAVHLEAVHPDAIDKFIKETLDGRT